MTWGYRVCKESCIKNQRDLIAGATKQGIPPQDVIEEYKYRIIEIYYLDGEIRWADIREDVLVWYDLEDLALTLDLLQSAIKKPVLLIEGEKLIETDEIY